MLKRKILPIFCGIILLFSTIATNLTANAAFNPSFELHSEGVYMVNLDTDIVVAEKNPDMRLYPASVTKIMTALVAFENIKDFNKKLECPYDCFNEFQWGGDPNYYDASTGGIDPYQDNLTYMDCLYALMVASACEAGNIIAYNVCGDIPTFINLMNETAKKIGCENTHFANTHGLWNENNYTSARDMYKITRYAMDNYEGFNKICNTYEYKMPANEHNPGGYTLYQTNAMMSESSEYYFEGCTGVKTGSIYEYYLKKGDGWDTENPVLGSRSLVTVAEQNGYRYLCVTLSAPYYNPDGTSPEKIFSYVDHINLYNWAFGEFEYSKVIDKNQQIMQVNVIKGKEAEVVGLVTTEDYFTLMPKSLDKSAIQLIKPDVQPLTAPVEKDMEMGEVELRLNGEKLTAIPLVTETAIELDKIADYKEKLENFLKSPVTIAAFVALVLLIVALIVIVTINKHRKQRAAEMNRRRKIRMTPPRNGRNSRNNRK